MFGMNMAVGIWGAILSHRVLWITYLLFSRVAFVMVSAATPLVGMWLASKLL
jgi:hypothetical protein